MKSVENGNFSNGSHTISRWELDGIQLVHVQSQFKEQMTFPASNDDNFIRLHFGLYGDYAFKHLQLNRSFSALAGRQNFMYSDGFNIQVQSKSPNLETFGIKFPKQQFIQYTQGGGELLARFCDAIVENKPALLSDQWPLISIGAREVIQEICNSNYTGQLQELFLLSKSIELLVLSAEAHIQPTRSSSKFINGATDREKIYAAKEMVEQSIKQPKHLSALAKAVGINEYKLKGGFKELFGTTVFGYVRILRLKQAKQYLLETDMTAAEIASTLGYSSPQHFSAAFKKHFGISPLRTRNKKPF